MDSFYRYASEKQPVIFASAATPTPKSSVFPSDTRLLDHAMSITEMTCRSEFNPDF
jgi:hypothetical protein